MTKRRMVVLGVVRVSEHMIWDVRKEMVDGKTKNALAWNNFYTKQTLKICKNV